MLAGVPTTVGSVPAVHPILVVAAGAAIGALGVRMTKSSGLLRQGGAARQAATSAAEGAASAARDAAAAGLGAVERGAAALRRKLDDAPPPGDGREGP